MSHLFVVKGRKANQMKLMLKHKGKTAMCNCYSLIVFLTPYFLNVIRRNTVSGPLIIQLKYHISNKLTERL